MELNSWVTEEGRWEDEAVSEAAQGHLFALLYITCTSLYAATIKKKKKKKV